MAEDGQPSRSYAKQVLGSLLAGLGLVALVVLLVADRIGPTGVVSPARNERAEDIAERDAERREDRFERDDESGRGRDRDRD